MGDRAIVEAIQAAAGTQLADTVHSVTATVDSVNVLARTCDVTVLTGKCPNSIPGVKLMAALDDGILIVPAIDSTVQIIVSTYTEPYVSQYSGVSSIIMLGGDLGGVPITPALIIRLNLLENKVNDLINNFNSHTHIGVTLGSDVSGITGAQINGTLTDTIETDIANPNIKQG